MQLPALSFHSKKENKQGIRTCLPVVNPQKMAQFPKSSESGDGGCMVWKVMEGREGKWAWRWTNPAEKVLI